MINPLIRSIMIAALTICSCAPLFKGRNKHTPTKEIYMEPLVIGLKPDTSLGLSDFDATTLFFKGVEQHQAGNCDRALVFYLRLFKDFAASQLVAAASYNAGCCFENLDRFDQAIAHYRLITVEVPQSDYWLRAAYRESLCLIHLNRHAQASRLLNKILDLDDLSISEKMELLVLLGESLSEQGKYPEAENKYHKILDLYHTHQQEEFLDPLQAANAQFNLGRLVEDRFQAAPLRLPEEQIQKDLEDKAALLLQAQSAYLRAIRLGDPSFAVEATYRIGTLYIHLHKAIDKAPVPSDLEQEEIQVYQNTLRRRTVVLLRKALKAYELTVQLSERTQIHDHNVEMAREEMNRIEALILSLDDNLPIDDRSKPELSTPPQNE